MRPDQLELALAGRLAHRRLERGVQLGDAAERPPSPRRLRDPWRVLEQRAQSSYEPSLVQTTELGQGERRG